MTGTELSRATGATPRQIDYWARGGYLGPGVDRKPGSGQNRCYDDEAVVRCRILVRLSLVLRPRAGARPSLEAVIHAIDRVGIDGSWTPLPGLTFDFALLGKDTGP